MSNATNSNAIISKSKNIFSVFRCISGIYIKFRILWKKAWASEVLSFWNYRLQRAGLLKCLKNPMTENSCTVNMLNRPKDSLNPHGSIFLIFFDHSEKGSARKVLVVSYIFRLFVNILPPDDKYSLSVNASV